MEAGKSKSSRHNGNENNFAKPFSPTLLKEHTKIDKLKVVFHLKFKMKIIVKKMTDGSRTTRQSNVKRE
jgi:hypothetical protein